MQPQSDNAVLCMAENNMPIRIRDVDRVLRSERGVYLILRNLHKTLFGSIFHAVEHSTGRFVVLKQTVRASFQNSAPTLEDPWAECEILRHTHRSGSHRNVIQLLVCTPARFPACPCIS
jgi:hypothetical protein